MTKKRAAWLTENGRLICAVAPSPFSPIIALIEKIYGEAAPGSVSRARVILRNRIFSNIEPSFSDLEAVKVAAKRISAPVELPTELEVLLASAASGSDASAGAVDMRSFSDADLEIGQILSPSELPSQLEKLRSKVEKKPERWLSDRPVSALLLDSEDRVMAWAWNTNSVLRNRHAEWNLCAMLENGSFGGRRKIPAGAKLYVSLKPCRMCAARIWEMAEDPAHLFVQYLENDPGPHAQGTMLDAESPARVRYLGMKHPLFGAELQEKITIR